MKTYRVWWTIDVEANCPEDAASIALEIQRDPASMATVFEVSEKIEDEIIGEYLSHAEEIDADPAALERSES